MKAMIGNLVYMDVDRPADGVYQPIMEFSVLFFEENGEMIGKTGIHIPFNQSTNQNQLLAIAKEKTIEVANAQFNRTIGVNDIKSAVLQ
jgi:hypothetical protein